MSHTPSVGEIRLCAIHGRDHVTEEEFHRGMEAVRRAAKAEALRKAARSFRPLHRGREDDYIAGRADERHDLCAQLTLIADDIEAGRDE